MKKVRPTFAAMNYPTIDQVKERLRILRGKHGAHNDLSRRSGVARSTLSRITHSSYAPSYETVRKLLEAMEDEG
jgi:transcriptional regulator with XRE-family HTH domain